MPYHSKKNIHRADFDIRQEQLDWEENDEDYRKEIYDMIEDIDSFTECGDRTYWYDSVYEPLKYRDYSAFDDYWVHEKHYPFYALSYRTQKQWCKRCNNYGCKCSFRYCSCDMCYEVCTATIYNAKPLIQKYFSVQEIHDMNERIIQEHCSKPEKRCCQQYYVDCQYYPTNTTSPLIKKENEPDEIDMRFVTLCTVQHFLDILNEKAKELHNQKENHEKAELLAKYGLTLADHEEMKRQRRENLVNTGY